MSKNRDDARPHPRRKCICSHRAAVHSHGGRCTSYPCKCRTFVGKQFQAARGVAVGFKSGVESAVEHEAALVKAFSDFATHRGGCGWGGWMTDKIDTCDCGLSAAIRACPPLRKAFKMKANRR